jgi:hypothetical protein
MSAVLLAAASASAVVVGNAGQVMAHMSNAGQVAHASVRVLPPAMQADFRHGTGRVDPYPLGGTGSKGERARQQRVKKVSTPADAFRDGTGQVEPSHPPYTATQASGSSARSKVADVSRQHVANDFRHGTGQVDVAPPFTATAQSLGSGGVAAADDFRHGTGQVDVAPGTQVDGGPSFAGMVQDLGTSGIAAAHDFRHGTGQVDVAPGTQVDGGPSFAGMVQDLGTSGIAAAHDFRHGTGRVDVAPPDTGLCTGQDWATSSRERGTGSFFSYADDGHPSNGAGSVDVASPYTTTGQPMGTSNDFRDGIGRSAWPLKTSTGSGAPGSAEADHDVIIR